MKDERTLEEMLAEQCNINRARTHRARCAAIAFHKEIKDEQSHGYKRKVEEELTAIYLLEAFQYGVAANVETFGWKYPGLSRKLLMKLSIRVAQKGRLRRDPFKDLGIYSGLTEPMKPRPW